MADPVRMQVKFEPRALFVPALSLSSSTFGSVPVRTSNRHPSCAVPSVTGSTQAFLPSLVESMKDDTKGTITPFAAGSGERTVRAQSHAITVAFEPSGSVAFG